MRKKQIEEFLKSDDLEMVRLGARFLQKFVPKSRWVEILEECSINKKLEGDQTVFWGPERKWNYKIVKREIIIEDPIRIGSGTWTQPGTGYKHTYNIKVFTGSGGMKLIQKAIGEYYKKNLKPTKKNEQTKKTYRKQTKH